MNPVLSRAWTTTFSRDRPNSKPVQLFPYLSQSAIELLLVELAYHDVVPGLGRDLGDSVAHQPAADDPNLLDVHVASRSVRRAVERAHVDWRSKSLGA